VKGGVAVESADGEAYEARNRVTLCRCGRSNNKPFCDGTHVDVRFNDGDESLKK
jgi:CDGSH-type Zn-finger protein